MPMTKAYNLEDAVRNLDPAQPLRPEDEALFVERDHSQRLEMVKRLQLMLRTPGKYAKFLFTGHRGAGKGTELFRLGKEVEADFCVVNFMVSKDLEVADLDYRDVLFMIGIGIVKTVNDNPALANSIPKALLAPIYDFVKEIYQEQEYKEKYESEAKVSASILEFIAAFARIGTERSTRRIVREKISGSQRKLLEGIESLARFIEGKLKRRILVIVEDLDKLDPKKARELFFDHGKSLTDPSVDVIYTFPVSLRHSMEFPQIKTYFQNFDLPNIKTKARGGADYAAGLEKLEDILKRRVSEGLFEDTTLRELAQQSGGLVRSLISLTNEACLQALLAGRTKVSSKDVSVAVAEERASYHRILNKEQLDMLRQIHQSKEIGNTSPEQELLYNLSVLEYRNDDPTPWYDVHPIVQPLLP
jgi:hypothetical protein